MHIKQEILKQNIDVQQWILKQQIHFKQWLFEIID
jgi:hypothetical protein